MDVVGSFCLSFLGWWRHSFLFARYTNTLICRFEIFSTQIFWPPQWTNDPDGSPTFLLTVDGIHCKISEPRQGEKEFVTRLYSHKFHSAGLNYEVGISVFTNQVVWLSGPQQAATADITIYREGLLQQIPPGKRVIGDKGYRGEPETVSVTNRYDSKQLKKFKVSAFHELLFAKPG